MGAMYRDIHGTAVLCRYGPYASFWSMVSIGNPICHSRAGCGGASHSRQQLLAYIYCESAHIGQRSRRFWNRVRWKRHRTRWARWDIEISRILGWRQRCYR